MITDQPCVDPAARHAAAATAACAVRMRRDRVFADHAGLFGDPGWDILLALYTGAGGGLPEHVAPSVAGRYAEALIARGLVERAGTTLDDAAALRLSTRGRTMIDRCFEDA